MAFAETSWWSHDEELQADLREWIRRAADGKYVEYEAEHPLPSGGTMAVSGTIRPVTDDEGAVRSLIASARDVTERREHQRQLEESNERLERFAYVASHDLQEPLRTISNYVELIAEEYGEDLDDDAEQFIDVVTTGSERMQSMINGLLDYSRVTTRGDEFEPVDAEAVAADVADDLTIMLDEEDGTMTWSDLPTVTADGDQLRQVVQNLVKNALEHSGGEPVEVEIRGRDVGDAYRFAVADDGPGIEPNRQEKIFRIFKSGKQYQTSSQAKGIGLAICDNIVQRHGGDIWVESEPGDGATFVFTIDKDQ
jgi:light-regulated signal transduction histidine kinase (bacteriophytochrome)